ncbi:MAG: hypothetical protein LBK27_07245 [Treponema sp.]|jgi:hypothetical protein|nr:hypothetical protein [Treponema sp.]
MKIIVMLISALALVFSSCATGQKGSRGGSGRTGQAMVETREAVLFADGSLDEYTTLEYDPSFTNMLGQSRYSASGALLEKVEFAYQDEQGWLTTRLTRDVEDRLKNRIVYQYNEQGLLWKEFLTNQVGKTVSSYEYGYDSAGNRVSRIIKNGADVKLAETLYTFNDAGAVIASETRDGAGKKINSTENQYDSRGNLIDQKIYNGNGELITVISAVWRDGVEVENEQKGQDGAVQLRITSEYNRDGQMTRKTIEDFQGESTRIMEYEYTPRPGQEGGK